MRRMEQHFAVRWTNPSQVIRFQVSGENTKSNGGLSYLCLLVLGLPDDAEVEINDVLGEGDNITFIVKIEKEPATTILRIRYLFIFLTSSIVTFEWRASCSLSSHVFSHYTLKVVEAYPLQWRCSKIFQSLVRESTIIMLSSLRTGFVEFDFLARRN